MKPKCDQVHLCLQDIALVQPWWAHMLASLTLSSSPADAPLTAYAAGQPLVAQDAYSKAVEKARMQITLFFWPLKVLTSPLTHMLEGQGPVRHRQDVWWSVYVPCDEVMRNPATMNGRLNVLRLPHQNSS